jgi:hypothetical protein
VQTEAAARATADSALAANVTTLQTRVDGNTNSVQVLSQSINGIKGKYGVRIDTNGYITGWELIGGATSGSMIIHVDNLLIGRPGATNQYPFVIGVVDGVQRISLSNAFIQDGSIKNAKIQDLTVGRIKLASGGTAGLSWGVSSYNNWGLYDYSIPTEWTQPSGGSVSIATESRGRVLVTAFIRALAGGQFVYSGIFKDGSQVTDMGIISNQSSAHGMYIDSSPKDGTTTYSVRVRCTAAPNHGYLWSVGICALAIYR